MTTIPELIDVLVERGAPVRRLRPPLMRAVGWLALAALILAVLAIGDFIWLGYFARGRVFSMACVSSATCGE